MDKCVDKSVDNFSKNVDNFFFYSISSYPQGYPHGFVDKSDRHTNLISLRAKKGYCDLSKNRVIHNNQVIKLTIKIFQKGSSMLISG